MDYIERIRAYHRKYDKSFRGKWRKLRSNAKRRGIPVNLGIDEFIDWYNQQEKLCYYCGVSLDGDKAGRGKANGQVIERRDNNKGYDLDNIVLACFRCNIIKGSWFTEQQMLEVANKYFK